MIVGTKIFCANVGDSRAILCRNFQDPQLKSLLAIPLSRDHKTTELDEHDRIIRCGGIVHPLNDANGNKVGPNRIWLKNEDVPGLTITRSFGD